MATIKNVIVILATARAKPGKEAELERALRDAAEPTRAQQGDHVKRLVARFDGILAVPPEFVNLKPL